MEAITTGPELGESDARGEQAERMNITSNNNLRFTILLYLNVKSHTQVEYGFLFERHASLLPADNRITAVTPGVQTAVHTGGIEPGLQQNVAPSLTAVA